METATLWALPSEIYTSLAEFLPADCQENLSQTCTQLQSIYRPLSWRFAVVVSENLVKESDELTSYWDKKKRNHSYRRVPVGVVLTPQKHSWFLADCVRHLALADWDFNRQEQVMARQQEESKSTGEPPAYGHYTALQRVMTTHDCMGQVIRAASFCNILTALPVMFAGAWLFLHRITIDSNWDTRPFNLLDGSTIVELRDVFIEWPHLPVASYHHDLFRHTRLIELACVTAGFSYKDVFEEIEGGPRHWPMLRTIIAKHTVYTTMSATKCFVIGNSLLSIAQTQFPSTLQKFVLEILFEKKPGDIVAGEEGQMMDLAGIQLKVPHVTDIVVDSLDFKYGDIPWLNEYLVFPDQRTCHWKLYLPYGANLAMEPLNIEKITVLSLNIEGLSIVLPGKSPFVFFPQMKSLKRLSINMPGLLNDVRRQKRPFMDLACCLYYHSPEDALDSDKLNIVLRASSIYALEKYDKNSTDFKNWFKRPCIVAGVDLAPFFQTSQAPLDALYAWPESTLMQTLSPFVNTVTDPLGRMDETFARGEKALDHSYVPLCATEATFRAIVRDAPGIEYLELHSPDMADFPSLNFEHMLATAPKLKQVRLNTDGDPRLSLSGGAEVSRFPYKVVCAEAGERGAKPWVLFDVAQRRKFAWDDCSFKVHKVDHTVLSEVLISAPEFDGWI